MRKIQYILPTLALMAALLLLAGCRTRLFDEAPPPDEPQAYEAPEQPSEPEETPYIAAEPDALALLPIEVPQEDAHRYATAPLDPADEPNHEPDPSQPEPIGIAIPDPPEEPPHIVTTQAPEEEPDEEPEETQAVLGADGGVIGIVADYTGLLRTGVNTLFPCQLRYVFAETTEPLVTVPRGSDIYQLMIAAGGQNISTRLAADRLTVEADWVVRRHPDVIVKFTAPTVLGNQITTPDAAMAQRATMLAREGWYTLEAVREGRVLLFSQQMLETDGARLAVKLLVSRALYPELFDNMDVDSVVAELTAHLSGWHILL